MSVRKAYKNAQSVQRNLPVPRRNNYSPVNFNGPSKKFRLFKTPREELDALKSENRKMAEIIEKMKRKWKRKEALLRVVDKHVDFLEKHFSANANNSNWQAIFEDYENEKFGLLRVKVPRNSDDRKYVQAIEEIKRIEAEVFELEAVREPTSEDVTRLEEAETLRSKMKRWEMQRDIVNEGLEHEKNEKMVFALRELEKIFDKYRNLLIEQFTPIYRKHFEKMEKDVGTVAKTWRETVKIINDVEFLGVTFEYE